MDGQNPQLPPPPLDPTPHTDPFSAPPAPAPPTPVPGGEAPAFSVDTPESVVITEQPKRRRTGLIAAAVILVVGGLVAGGVLLAQRGDDAPTFSLEEATKNAAAQTSSAMTITTTSLGQTLTIDAEIDRTANLMHMNMDLGAMLGTDTSIEAIADIGAKALYFKSDLFRGLGATVDTDWIKMDQTSVDKMGQDASLFDQFDLTTTVDVANLFEAATDVKEIGDDEVDGEKVRHYQVTVPGSEVLKGNPQLQNQLDQLDVPMPDEIVYDVYVTEANEFRRMTSEMDLGASKTKVDIVVTSVNEPVSIEVPAAEDVTDILDLL